jgi:hypothetical protein
MLTRTITAGGHTEQTVTDDKQAPIADISSETAETAAMTARRSARRSFAAMPCRASATCSGFQSL